MSTVQAEFEAAVALLSHLAAAPEWPEACESASKTEAQRLARLIGSEGVAATDLPWLLEALASSSFRAEDKVTISQAITNARSTVGAQHGHMVLKRKSQEWADAIPHLLTHAVWDDLARHDVQSLFHHLGRLGLRLPSEATCKAMSLCMSVASDGLEATNRKSKQLQLSQAQLVKSMWKRSGVANLGHPTEWVQQLGTDWQGLYSRVFGYDQTPAKRPMTDKEWK